MIKKLTLMTVFFTLMTGCAAQYKSPQSSDSSIAFKMTEGMPDNTNQFFSIYSSSNCEDIEGEGRAATFSTGWGKSEGPEKEVAIISDSPTYILAKIDTFIGGVGKVYVRQCNNLFGFTPRKGETYSVEQRLNCLGVIVNDTSGNEIEVKLMKASHRCRKDGK